MDAQEQKIRDDMKAIRKALEWMDKVSEEGREYLNAQVQKKLAGWNTRQKPEGTSFNTFKASG